MPQSLHRTWAALAVATLAVLVITFLAGRDFVRDVRAPCPGTLIPNDSVLPGRLDPVAMRLTPSEEIPSGRAFELVVEPTLVSGRDVPRTARLLWKEPASDGACACGSIPVSLAGHYPWELNVFQVRGTNQYVVRTPTTTANIQPKAAHLIFTLEPGIRHRVQWDRIVSRRQLPGLVALLALGALLVAAFRSRRAIAYALRLHSWSEARLTPGGLIENEAGAMLGTLEQTRARAVPPGPVLIAPDALSTTGLYRDVPIVARRQVAEGSHARWASGTMLRLRDARALAVISTACAMLAFGARLIA